MDLHVLLDAGQTLEAAHALTESIEAEVQKLLPEADATVHLEPWTPPTQGKEPGLSRRGPGKHFNGALQPLQSICQKKAGKDCLASLQMLTRWFNSGQ